ncbi:MAG: cytochrome [Caulobacteraceae bacterium]|nr:cytochrome [Caulobacteraceae bacterium]
MTDDSYRTHFKPMPPPEEVFESAEFMLKECPVAHSDQDGGFWVVNRHRDALAVLTDWRTFSSPGRVPAPPPGIQAPPMPPIDLDPPLQRDFRNIINPYLTPEVVEIFKPRIQKIVTELIDQFIDNGCCDLSGQFARPFASRVTFEILFDLDDPAQLELNLGFVHTMTYEFGSPKQPAAEKAWIEWMLSFVRQRRAQAPRHNLIDGLIHGTVDGGRPLTDEELYGAIMIITLGGFGTTADAIGNLMIRIAEDRSLQSQLRGDLGKLPDAIEESLRLEPPVSGVARTCTRQTTIGERTIEASERVLINFTAANRDPERFDDPGRFDMARDPAHLAFSGGPHRCVGSNLARLDIRLAFEELLTRMKNIRITPGDQVKRVSNAAAWWVPNYVPITFDRAG